MCDIDYDELFPLDWSAEKRAFVESRMVFAAVRDPSKYSDDEIAQQKMASKAGQQYEKMREKYGHNPKRLQAMLKSCN